MKCIKVLYLGFLVVIMLGVVSSCGVPSPTQPTVTATTADTSTINTTDSIDITFSTSMVTGSLALSGDMADESDHGVWSRAKVTNDTLTISPSIASGGEWTTGIHTLIVDVEATSGESLPTLTLTYTIDVTPAAKTIFPADTAVINNIQPIVIFFNVAMDPATLILTGDMVGESDGGKWASTTNTNDTLSINPSGAWTAGAHTLIIDVKAENTKPLAPPGTLTLNYIVDDALLINSVTPAPGSFITGGVDIVIDFGESVDIATLVASGSLWDNSNFGVWSTKTYPNDTLTLSPATSWPEGAIDLTLEIVDLVGNSLAPLTLNYTVDVTPPIIALLGAQIINIGIGTPYVDAGAIAVDNNDNITSSIVVAGDVVVVNTVGIYIITYNVSDKAGNAAIEVTRTVNVN